MPLTFCNVGSTNIVRKVGGSTEVRRHLKELGFVEGSSVTVVSQISGNMIVSIKGCRIAIDKAMAVKIAV